MTSRLIPALKYRDAPAAISFLVEAFGFERHLVVDGEEGTVVHAQLVGFGGMIMLGSMRDDEYGRMMSVPAEGDGRNTQGLYVVVDDVDAAEARASGAGAEIVTASHDVEHGGRLFICKDPEGHVWSFGSYDPFAEPG